MAPNDSAPPPPCNVGHSRVGRGASSLRCKLRLGICSGKLLRKRGNAGIALCDGRGLRGELCVLGSELPGLLFQGCLLGCKRLALLLDGSLLRGDLRLERDDLVCRKTCSWRCSSLGRGLARKLLGSVARGNGLVCTLLGSLGALFGSLELLTQIIDLLLGCAGPTVRDWHAAVARIIRCLHAVQGACDDSSLGDVFAMREIINHRHVV